MFKLVKLTYVKFFHRTEDLRLHMLFLTHDVNAIKKIIALLSQVQISVCSMSCAGNARCSEKLQKD